MDGFSYTDIFDTKGIEYLIIIAFLLLIIPVWILYQPTGNGEGRRQGSRPHLIGQYSQDTRGSVLQPVSYLGFS